MKFTFCWLDAENNITCNYGDIILLLNDMFLQFFTIINQWNFIVSFTKKQTIVPVYKDLSAIVPVYKDVSDIVPVYKDVSAIVPVYKDVSAIVPVYKDVSVLVLFMLFYVLFLTMLCINNHIEYKNK
jgi:hypothetical protein